MPSVDKPGSDTTRIQVGCAQVLMLLRQISQSFWSRSGPLVARVETAQSEDKFFLFVPARRCSVRPY